MHSLPIFIKITGTPVILIGTGEAADAKRRLIERAGGIVIAEDDAQALQTRLAFVALDDDAQAETAATRLKAAGKLINVADRPALCDFTLPAIVDRDPVLIAVATGGASAGLAAALRQRLEEWLPDWLGHLADRLKAARDPMRARWPDGGARRRALAQALAPGGALDPLSSGGDVEAWLQGGGDAPAAETAFVTLCSDNPDLLTLAEARALARADRIVHPHGTPAAILARARADALRIEAEPDDPLPDHPGLTVRIAITAL